MPLTILIDWKCEKCKGKTILIPVISISKGKKPVYMTNLIDNRFVKPMASIYETDNLVIITPLQYGTPYSEQENLPAQEKRVEKAKKDN